MTKYPEEDIYELWWHGPFTLETLKNEPRSFLETLSLYARHDDHPIYGRDVLTYIGKAVDQMITKRLDQHGIDSETIYVANVTHFINWDHSEELGNKPKFDVKDFIRSRDGDSEIISRIEELLIYSLRPADNKRNKSSAAHSWRFRIFNTGARGSLPQELSGHYALHNAPNDQGLLVSKK